MTEDRDVNSNHPDDGDDFWGREFDIQEQIEAAKKLRIVLDGADVHRQLEALLARLDDEELSDMASSLVYLAPQVMGPFELVNEATLVRILAMPDTTYLSDLVASVARFLATIACAGEEEEARRIEKGARRRRGG